jgi:Zn-dependent protease with chaperone function
MAVLLFKLPLAALAYRPLFLLLVLFLPLMTFYFLSRCFEYEADRQAVEFTNNPEAGIRALSALYRMTGAPTECGKFAELFMTHPSLMRRVVAIARLGQIPTVRVSEILVASGLPESLHDATQFQTF